MLPRELPIAAGGRAKVLSNWPAFALLLPMISVDGAGVGGKLGRGMMGRWPETLIGGSEGRLGPMLVAARGQREEDNQQHEETYWCGQ